mgnify:CR=1 FL=1
MPLPVARRPFPSGRSRIQLAMSAEQDAKYGRMKLAGLPVEKTVPR